MARQSRVTREEIVSQVVQGVDAYGMRGAGHSLWERLSRPVLLMAFVFCLLSLLPTAWGVYPLSYHVGQVSVRDVFSRVRFAWRDEDEEARRLQQIEEVFARMYRKEKNWMADIHEPVALLVESAEQAKDANEFLAMAKTRGVELAAPQAQLIFSEMRQRRGRVSAYVAVVYPMYRVLSEQIYARGLMEVERYREEMNREIQVVDPYGITQRVRIRPEGLDSPIDMTRVRLVLEDGFGRGMELVSPEFRNTLRDILLKRMRPSLRYDQAGSAVMLEKRKQQALRKTRAIEKDSLLLARDQAITPKVLRLLHAEDLAYRRAQGEHFFLLRYAGKVLLLYAIVLGLLLLLPAGSEQELRRTAALIGLLSLLCIGGAYSLQATRYFESLFPFIFSQMVLGGFLVVLSVALLAGVLGLMMGNRAAMMAVTAAALMVLIVLEARIGLVLGILGSGWLYGALVFHQRRRLGLIVLAIACGVLTAVLIAAWAGATGERTAALTQSAVTMSITQGDSLPGRMLSALLAWICGGVLVLSVHPLIERWSGRATHIRLYELQNQNHPCLRRLLVEAPGTYHHSVIVGTLAEAAVEAIGGDGLLAKVGSYFHDIGKILKPEYFSENESGMSRHDSLSPSMSTLIIVAHVKDGAEMARELKLPQQLIDIIEQHHGTSQVRFFLHRARKMAKSGEVVDDRSFCYPGPLPQTREAAVIMLADAVEAASRSLHHPAPAHIRQLVHDIIMDKFHAHQLEESHMTLTHLRSVEDTFVRILNSMYHSRVRYPGQAAEGNGRKGRA